MTQSENSYCNLLKESISGARGVDEETLASLAILTERLERVKKLGKGFSGIGFSPSVKKLAGRRRMASVS